MTVIGDPDGRIPLDLCVALREGISAAPGGQDFGFWLGRSVTVETLGMIGFAMRQAPDVRAAFRCVDRFGDRDHARDAGRWGAHSLFESCSISAGWC